MPEETTSRGRIAVIAQGVLVFDDPATTGLQVGGRTRIKRPDPLTQSFNIYGKVMDV